MPFDHPESFWLGEKYCGLARIGAGGMGEVWIGKDVAPGYERIVAIKRLRPGALQHHHRAITDEANILKHLSASTNIVNIMTLLIHEGEPYLIMEYIDGPELRDVLAWCSGPLPFRHAAYIVHEISLGLSYAHHFKHPRTGVPLHIVHRDVSPSNVLISSQGAVKLTDFGIAKSALQSTETLAGEIKGKFRYMSPEQFRGQPLDARSDYFSLGLILYECLVGRPAFDGKSDAEVMEQVRSGIVVLPEEIAPTVKHLLSKLLAIDPDKRYHDLEPFRKDLGNIALEHGGMGTAQTLAAFLKDHHIPQLKAALQRKQSAEGVSPCPKKSLPVETYLGRPKKPLRPLLFSLVGLGLAAGLFFAVTKRQALSPASTPPAVSPKATTGMLQVVTHPPSSQIALHYRDRKMEMPSPAQFQEIPFDIPLKLIANTPGYHPETRTLTLTPDNSSPSLSIDLKPLPPLSVVFTAEPPSEVSVPGFLLHREAPSPPVFLPAGNYKIIFSNPLAKHEVTTSLNAPQGGAFICRANMAIDPLTQRPSGQPATASCRSNP